ncbi:oxygenase MpaB family protein [Pseudomonas hefeiensis]|uniref:Oxygenase MpaB family protein n=1 Tax=Pseudomonas hefeiensis TaxID=2738125 RepID=A0ABY9GGM5_9PSED|nr:MULTISPECIES: oxygenase MpaB family protein [unclassified Pseudomonas]WLH14826.1 oxygenase MpaB family protein [Pseudomonas sp. FP205]WLH97879.1 oxygenase MpaB family protein [Pseudomonas sp. FP53]WLI42152.1 oxygenase MpaB family protein [Pseudomonas sp. FP821]
MNSSIQYQNKSSHSSGSGDLARLVNLKQARARHGAQADLMVEMLGVGDPLADAVISEINCIGSEAKSKLNEGLLHGLDAVIDPPPAVAAFLREVETIPAYADKHLLEAGDAVGLSIPPLLLFLSEQGIELVHVYASPSICRLLAQTGQLTKMTARRATETSLWHEQAVLPGGLIRGAPGYLATTQVRLLHARIRHNAIRQGWESGAFGVPINQTDIARTWLDFTIVPHLSLRKLGITLTEEEQRDRYRYWSYLGHVLGLDKRFYVDLRSDSDAEELLDLLDSTIDEPDDNCRALTHAILEVLTDKAVAGPLSMMDRESVKDFLNGLARFSFGDRLTDALQIPHSPAVGFLPLFAASTAQAWRFQRSNPELAAACTKEYVATRRARVAQMVSGHTAYQKNIEE